MHDRPRDAPSPLIVRLAALAALVVTVLGAHAASFDCQRASGAMAQAICASPRTSALDERLARTYERALHALSAVGASELKASQRGWLRFVTLACGRTSAGRGDTAGRMSAMCLETEFAHRIDELDQAGVRVGPYLFNRIDRYEGRPAPADDDRGAHSGIVTRHVGYLQIDAPRTASTEAWNAAHHRPLPPPSPGDDIGDDTDEDEVDTVACVGERFISVGILTQEYTHGSPHGSFGHATDNALLLPAMRQMTAADLFAADSRWQTRLPDLFWAAYLHEDKPITDMPAVEDAVREAAANPRRGC
jgi:uncharacterized protein YecT (DUF1311 family)